MPVPAYEKDNAVTQLDAQVRAYNRGKPLGARSTSFATAEPPPRVTTAAMRESILAPSPAALQEDLDRRNRLAAELGIEGYEQYKTSPPSVATVPPTPRMNQWGEILTRPFLPDFKKIQGIDIIKNVVVVDGVEFELPAKYQKTLISLCMRVVKNHIYGLLGKTKERKNKRQGKKASKEPSPAVQLELFGSKEVEPESKQS